jgi:hypothetical protein
MVPARKNTDDRTRRRKNLRVASGLRVRGGAGSEAFMGSLFNSNLHRKL